MRDLLTISNGAQDMSNAARELHAIKNAIRIANGRTLQGVIEDRENDIVEKLCELASDLGFEVVQKRVVQIRVAAE